jgi:hypothetical protein
MRIKGITAVLQYFTIRYDEIYDGEAERAYVLTQRVLQKLKAGQGTLIGHHPGVRSIHAAVLR